MPDFGPHASFILGAYGVALTGLAIMALASWRSARRLTRAADALRSERKERA
jgi:heme exporter protein CcmD